MDLFIRSVCVTHISSFWTATWATKVNERFNGDESYLIIPSHPSFSPLSSSSSPWTSPLSLPALHQTSLLIFPLLVTTWMCHCFYHFSGSCPLKRSEVISGVPKQRQDTRSVFSSHTNHHLLIPQWMAPPTPSTARPVGHMTVLTTPPRHGRKASGCINKGAKGGEEAEADQTR